MTEGRKQPSVAGVQRIWGQEKLHSEQDLQDLPSQVKKPLSFFLSFFPVSLVYYKRNSQTEVMHRTRGGKKAHSFHAHCRLTALPESSHVHQPGSSENWILFSGFRKPSEGFLPGNHIF